MKIPLYNCYWCACSYCIYKLEIECFDRCLLCIQNNKTKISECCEKFIENTKRIRDLYNEVQKCSKCKYRRNTLKIKKILDTST